MMTILNTKFVFLFLLSCVYFYANLSQSVSWFGPKKIYKCHCDNGCEKNGSCSQNGVCQKGWFGFKCQYQDLATIENVIPNPELDNLTDRNDSTCLDQQYQELNITWNRTYVFTWLRIVVNDTTLIPYINIEFTSPSHPSQNLTCDNKRLYLVNQQTLDIKCDVTGEIQSVLISGAGVKSICSLYINGEYQDRLKHFILQGRGPGPEYFSYNDTSDRGEPIYTVLDVSKTIVSNVTIIATFDCSGKFVTLCEVEIYGGIWVK
ncbi:uncharacterized protein LOC129926176 [Biomphalaria glabrata]|uniref:Uncharacterized protein LOC129926176 n=1 Tax=Biomphalaria glabrata TaxID=6526 RepID=A0A9W3AB94_BIOGL|nr:uncharacterized protein LOC129926176 [Biomphalaria glabrata]